MENEVPIAHILLDAAMCSWLKANANEQAKSLRLKRLPPSHNHTVGELKAERIKTCRGGGPIRITAFRDSGHYEIVDGRHRTVLAIQEGNTTIGAVIEDDDPSSRIDNMFV
jgi:hypothetical protein